VHNRKKTKKNVNDTNVSYLCSHKNQINMPDKERKDIEYQIEREEKEFREYMSVCHKIGLPQSVIDKRIDFHLDNLSRLFKILKTLKNQ